MSLRRLTAIVVVVVLIGLGVFFAFLLGAIASTGGTARIDVTHFGERWIEYLVMVALTATTPYALYYLTESSE
ncbi:hypothetical protein [Halomicrobium salinisoli]|uniref:hypothetical protein n=1 Tax=Halomicrobium salinisoli TaxID=2878391 RepID=UPI001CEFCD69|nr:hypothetical protein [Halomicrobium salinisoli]